MKEKTVVLFTLACLLVACGSSTPTSPPTAANPTASEEIPTQSSSQTFTPSPGQTQPQTPLPTAEASPTPTPENDFRLQRVAQQGGSIFGITIAGDVAYVGMGPRLAAIDISQHEHPQLIAQSQPLPGLVTQLLQISSGPAPLLLVNAGKYLVMMDTSNPDEPKPVHQLALAGAITAMAWDERGGILYAGSAIRQSSIKHTGLISAFRITADEQLKLITSVSLPEWPMSLALGKEGLFAGAEGDQGGLYYIPLKSPGELSTPRQVVASTPESPLQPTSMQVIGERLYLSYMTLEAYDISDPEQPVRAWEYLDARVVGKSFSLAGDQIYVFGWNIFSEYLCEAIRAEEPIDGTPIGVIASDTAMHKGDFLVAYHDLEIYDTADPQNLRLVGSFQTAPGDAVGAVANDEAVFVVDNRTGDGSSKALLRVLSLPALEPLGQVTSELPSGWTDGYRGVALDGDRLYLGTAERVWTYDVSNPQPVLLGSAGIEDGQLEAMAALRLGEQRLLITAQVGADDVSVLTMHEMTDPQNPARLGSPLPLDQGHVMQIIWNASAVYVLLDTSYHAEDDLLFAIDFENHSLTVRDSFALRKYVNAMAVDGEVVVVTGTDRLSIVSTVASEPLKLLAEETLPERGYGVAMVRDQALVLVGDSNGYEYGVARLLAFDIQNPANPRQVGEMNIAASLNSRVPMLVIEGYVVLANGKGGVEVLGYGSPSLSPTATEVPAIPSPTPTHTPFPRNLEAYFLKYDPNATPEIPPPPRSISSWDMWRDVIPATPVEATPQFILYPPPADLAADAQDLLIQAGCTVDRYSVTCGQDSPLSRFGCYWGVEDPSWISFPTMPDLSLVAECNGKIEDWEKAPQDMYIVGCAFRSKAGFIFKVEEEYLLVNTVGQMKALFVPIESPSEALGYAQMMTGLRAYFELFYDPDLLYLQTSIEGTHVIEDNGSYLMNLYHTRGCGCEPWMTSEVTLQVARDGTITWISALPVFFTTGYSCAD